MLGPVGLDEEGAAVRVEAERQECRRHLAGPAPQHVRVMGRGQRVVVDDAVDRLVLVLEADVVPDRAQVVAEMDGPGWLDAAERPAANRLRGESGGGTGVGRHRGAECSGGWPGPAAEPAYPRRYFGREFGET